MMNSNGSRNHIAVLRSWMLVPAMMLAAAGCASRPQAKAPVPASSPVPATADVRVISSFENGSPFGPGKPMTEFASEYAWPVVSGEMVDVSPAGLNHPEWATDGTHALRVGHGALCLPGPLDWRGYDDFVFDVFNTDEQTRQIEVDFQDVGTETYWKQGLYTTWVKPGHTTVIVPIRDLNVGGRGRPTRSLDIGHLRLVVIRTDRGQKQPLYLDYLRLEKDLKAEQIQFEGLWAFDAGAAANPPPENQVNSMWWTSKVKSSPLMKGFRRLDPTCAYTKERGWGFTNVKVFKYGTDDFVDSFHPDSLYRDAICIESGALAVDVPNGKYHVFMNIDSSSAYWGDYQFYRNRKVYAQGKLVVDDNMDFEGLKRQYFRDCATEDMPGDDVYHKYVDAMFHEKQFDVDVVDGQIKLAFEGKEMAICLSAVVIYPVEKSKQGEAFLQWVREQRRREFDIYCNEVPRTAEKTSFQPTTQQKQAGMALFHRDIMRDVFYNDTPTSDQALPDEKAGLSATALRGQTALLEVDVVPLENLGTMTLTISDLKGPGVLAAKDADVGFVSNRVSRVVYCDSQYTFTPRWLMPSSTVAMPKGVTRRFVVRIPVSNGAVPGTYTGKLRLEASAAGRSADVGIALEVIPAALEPADIPVGPFYAGIDIPWFGDDAHTIQWRRQMEDASFERLRREGFTSFTGPSGVVYKGFVDGKPQFDFTEADRQMANARRHGFSMAIMGYTDTQGLNRYNIDTAAMKAAGFTDYSAFLKVIFGAIQQHAQQDNWLPVYWCLGDEPSGKDAVIAACENAEAYRKAFPDGSPGFTFCGSCDVADPSDMHFRMAKAAHVATWNLHTADAINLLHSMGGEWAFYNGGSRWTLGTYMYKCAREYGMKYRIVWHWNCAVGNPYYSLDCREDDNAWCNATPDGQLVPSMMFIRYCEGLTDYRLLLTLEKLAKANPGSPAGQAAQRLIADRMASFKLGERDHDARFGVEDYAQFRDQMISAIKAMAAKPQ